MSRSGEIVTFYSYKGGTGRSMLLANVAWILAGNGRRVLAVAWDLEAPGLHRYFHPFLSRSELESASGVVDLVSSFASAAVTPKREHEPPPPLDWYRPLANVVAYTIPLSWNFGGGGVLDLMSPGRFGSSYADRVAAFGWQEFYERLGGGDFLDAVKESMRAEYDYVLVDSRTGLSDTAGVCTVQLPRTLVVCFTYNHQSIEGAAGVAASVWRQKKGDVCILPVALRVEDGERALSSCRYMVALFGRQVTQWQLKEISTFLSFAASSGQRRIVPILLEGAQPPAALRDIKMLDGSSAPREDILAAVLRALEGESVDRVSQFLLARSDPNKGKFGGKPFANGRALRATVKSDQEIPDLYRLFVEVASEEGSAPINGAVTFHLHPTFESPTRTVLARDGRAALRLVSSGSFTVGVDTDGGKTRLEFDLADLPGVPRRFQQA